MFPERGIIIQVVPVAQQLLLNRDASNTLQGWLVNFSDLRGYEWLMSQLLHSEIVNGTCSVAFTEAIDWEGVTVRQMVLPSRPRTNKGKEVSMMLVTGKKEILLHEQYCKP